MSAKKQILISVIIPVFDNLNGLKDAVKSVNDQGLEQLEIIVVDDKSAQSVHLAEFAEIRILHHEKNRGPAAARNTGMAQAKGKYIAFLDSDDRWAKGKLKEQFRLMEALPDEIAGVFTPFHYDGHPHKVFNAKLFRNNWFDYFLMGCRVAPGSTFMFRRTLFDAIGPQDESLRRFEDWDWLLRAAQKYRFVHAPTAMTVLGSASRANGNVIEENLKEIEDKWLPRLEGIHRQTLQAAFELECCVTALRQGKMLNATAALMKALTHSSGTVLYNLVWKYSGKVIGNKHHTD